MELSMVLANKRAPGITQNSKEIASVLVSASWVHEPKISTVTYKSNCKQIVINSPWGGIRG